MALSDDILSLCTEALMLALVVSVPLLGAALLSSLFTAVLQSMTRVSETALSIVPRILAVAVTLVFAGPWIGGRVAEFAERVWSLMQAV